MNYQEVIKSAAGQVGEFCKACPVCNGKACSNHMPGPGAKGSGMGAIRNFEAWKNYKVNMDTIYENGEIDTSLSIFGKTFAIPVFAGPVGAVNMHYGDKYNDMQYNDILVGACEKNGIAAFTGDGMQPEVMVAATKAIKSHNGIGVPTVKPWSMDVIREKMDMVSESGSFAVAMDIDAAGLPFLKNCNPPAGSKSVDQMREIIGMQQVPFIVKGIISVKGALKARQAGADAIVVSNHGGRVLDECPASAEVLMEIADALKGSGMKILVDGGIRDGVTVFKALAMGADGVIIARPFVTAVYGAGEEGVKAYVEKLTAELSDTMAMCGAKKLSEITRDMIRY